MTTLLTATETIKSTPVHQNFPVAAINKVLQVRERALFESWLGEDFYKILIADLADHSAAVQWVNGTSYTLGSKVILEDYVFVSLINSNTEAPINSNNWTEAAKFDTGEYNTLWDNYLRVYLALETIKMALPFATYSIDSGGASESYTEQGERRSAGAKAYNKLEDTIDVLINDAQGSLKKYIDNAHEESTTQAYYEKVGYIQNFKPAAQPQNRGRRRIMWRK